MHTQTHSSLWYTRDEVVTCTRLWSREGVGPKRIQARRHCGSEGQTDPQRAGSRHSPALTPLREGRPLPHSIVKFRIELFFPVPLLMQIINTSWPWEPKMLARKRPWTPKTRSLGQSAVCTTSAFRVGQGHDKLLGVSRKGKRRGFVSLPSLPKIIYTLPLSPNYFTGYSICFFFLLNAYNKAVIQQTGFPKQVSQRSHNHGP